MGYTICSIRKDREISDIRLCELVCWFFLLMHVDLLNTVVELYFPSIIKVLNFFVLFIQMCKDLHLFVLFLLHSSLFRLLMIRLESHQYFSRKISLMCLKCL